MSTNFFIPRDEIIESGIANEKITSEIRKSVLATAEEIYNAGAGGIPCNFRKLRKICNVAILQPYIDKYPEQFQEMDADGNIDWSPDYWNHDKSEWKTGNIAKLHPDLALRRMAGNVNKCLGEILNAIEKGYSYKDVSTGDYLSAGDIRKNAASMRPTLDPEESFKAKVKSFHKSLDSASPSDILVAEEELEQVKREIDARLL